MQRVMSIAVAFFTAITIGAANAQSKSIAIAGLAELSGAGATAG